MRGIFLQSNLSEHVLRALYELNFGFPLLRPALVLFSSGSGRYLNSQHHLKTKELLQVTSFEFHRFISYIGSTGRRQITSAINEQSD